MARYTKPVAKKLKERYEQRRKWETSLAASVTFSSPHSILLAVFGTLGALCAVEQSFDREQLGASRFFFFVARS